ncbi:RHS repeat domain-containing protein, partial [Microbulbifer epialgicus]
SGKTTLYIDKLFEKITGGGETQYRHFIGDIAVLTTTEKGSDVTHQIGFSHRDRLGSTAAVADEAGNLKESHSFDPFGKPRQGNILDKETAILESAYSTRGFTDHEHLDDVELIHMNGRAYDYNLGRFLSVDPVIQSPGNSQSLNPYSYIMNNPLAGTDPSGYTPDCTQGDDGAITCTGPVKVSQTGSRIKRTETGSVTMDTNGKLTGSITSGGKTQSFSIGKIVGQKSGGAADIGSQASRGNLQGGQGAADSGQSGEGLPDFGSDSKQIGLCASEGKCLPKDYSDVEKATILDRTNEITADIRNSSYGSTQAAAAALHENEALREMAEKYGLEFWAVIDKKTFAIKEVSTGFSSGEALGAHDGAFRPGDSIWHTHPSGRKVWSGDLQATVGAGGRWVFASGRQLSGIDVYTTGYTRPSQVIADYGRGNVTRHIYEGGEWSTEQYKF